MFGTSNNDSQNNGSAGSEPAAIPDNPFNDAVPPAAISTTSNATEPVSAAPAPASVDNLMDLKQQALQGLQPLVGHLDQTPEEKFKTTMMMIQATDNPALVKDAYAAANQIEDEKVRAQALLDVVNEINYFTHKDEK